MKDYGKVALSTILQHMQDNQSSRPTQHEIRKGRSCLANLIYSSDQMLHLVGEEKAVDVPRLQLSL